MNKERRQKLWTIKSVLAKAKDDLDSVNEDEEDAYDNMSESLQSGEQGQKSQEAIDGLGEVTDNLETSIDLLDSMIC